MPPRLTGLLLILLAAQAFAEPYTPTEDSSILERLPPGYRDNAARLRTLRAQQAAAPADPAAVAALVEDYLQQAQTSADPRFYGYAEAALAPWRDAPSPPVAILWVRALLHQARARPVAALADLEALLAREPDAARAWLLRAQVLRLRGDYPGALHSCDKLLGRVEPLLVAACRSSVLTLQGQAAKSAQILEKILAVSTQASSAAQQFARSVLADSAVRRGDAAAAERHFQAALALAGRDSSLLAQYADFLLDQQQAAAVRELLKDDSRDDSLLLRLALAEARLKGAQQNDYNTLLQERFAAAERRGDETHLADRVRALLVLFDQPQAALPLAQRLWARERTPESARLLLSAAAAANTPQAAQPVRDWLRVTGLEDVRLPGLLQEAGQ